MSSASSSPNLSLATGGIRCPLKRAFRRYEVLPESIRQKRRYEGNKIQPYNDPAFSVFLYWIPIEIVVPLVLESSVTSKITAHRRTSFQKAWLGVQTSSP